MCEFFNQIIWQNVVVCHVKCGLQVRVCTQRIILADGGANCDRYTLIIIVQALSNSTFQLMTLNQCKTSTILELKCIAQEFAIRSSEAHRLVIKYEHSGEILADGATFCSLNLHDVTVMNVSAAVTPKNTLQSPPCKTLLLSTSVVTI